MAGLKETPEKFLNQKSEAEISSSEILPSPERPRLRLKKSIALTGPESSGKGEVLKILKLRHGWKVFDGSEIGFKRKGTNPETGHIQRSKKQHKAMDKRQAKIFRNLNPDSEHLVDEAKLSGIIKAEQEDIRDNQIEKINEVNRPRIQKGRKDLVKAPDPIPAVTILLWANQETRVNRAYNDAINKYVAHFEKYLMQSELIMEGIKIPEDDLVPPPPDNPPTKEMIEKHMKDRQYQDTVDWAQDHPDYVKVGKNPYSRYLERPKNRGYVYDRWIDTTNLTPEEVADKFEEFALEMEAAEPLSFAELDAIERNAKKELEAEREMKSASFPEKGEIFDSKNMGEKDAEKTGKKIKTNGKNHPKESSEVKPKTETRSGKSVGEPVSRRNFPEKHPNPNHPSKNKR